MSHSMVIVLLMLAVMSTQRSFVAPAAIPQTPTDHGVMIGTHAVGGHAPETPQDAEVQELESLKQPDNEGQAVHIVKSQSSSIVNDNGNHNERHDLREYIDENGKLVASVHQHSESSNTPGEKPHEHVVTELEVPSEGIHKTIVHETSTEGQKEMGKAFPGAARLMQSAGEVIPLGVVPLSPSEITDNGNRRSFNGDILQEENNNMDHFSSYSGVQYSPLDMAEYIFWTGDEKGVTLAIEEFLQDGLMTREEAIAFLQEIKYNIDYLQTHYAQQRLKIANEDRLQQDKQLQENIQLQLNKNVNNLPSTYDNQRIPSAIGKFNHENMLKAITSGTFERNNNLGMPSSIPQLPFSLPDLRQNIYKKSIQDNLVQNSFKYASNSMPADQYERESTPAISEEDYEELLERLRVADFLYTEYSLEEVIYQLAKVMFTQSLARGSSEAQLALQKFTNFLESEAEQGRISRALEKKVLDVLIESLTDTLTEHPELVSAARVGLGGGVSLPPGNKMLRQLLELGPTDHAVTKAGIMAAYKEEVGKAKSSSSKFIQQAPWAKSREHSVGENQSGPLTMQPLKRFKMSA